jgi:small GTP-binding protein
MGIEEEIAKIEEELKNTKYNKATQYHIGLLKAKLARLKEKQENIGKKGVGAKLGVKKSGDATILLVGFPSVGKSTLLNKLTSADSKIGDYDFTTLDVIPGMMEYNSALIQILDVPGIIEGASSGKGRGKEVLGIVRNADLILILIDKIDQLPVIEKELYNAGFRLNEKKPDVVIKKSDRGGIKISGIKTKNIDEKMIKVILQERGIHNADVMIREDVTLDRFIDATCTNRVYFKAIVVFNKIDLLSEKEREMLPKDFLRISSLTGEGIEDLKKIIWEKLGLMRIYMKKIGKDPDMEKPLIIKEGSTVFDVAERIHKEFAKRLKYARIWGPSAKFNGQKVGIQHMLKDKDIVELHMENV